VGEEINGVNPVIYNTIWMEKSTYCTASVSLCCISPVFQV